MLNIELCETPTVQVYDERADIPFRELSARPLSLAAGALFPAKGRSGVVQTAACLPAEAVVALSESSGADGSPVQYAAMPFRA